MFAGRGPGAQDGVSVSGAKMAPSVLPSSVFPGAEKGQWEWTLQAVVRGEGVALVKADLAPRRR